MHLGKHGQYENLFSAADAKAGIERGDIIGELVRPFYGSEELIHAKPRACLWIREDQVSDASLIHILLTV